MSSKSIFKVWFKYEHKDEEATSTQYIEAYDKTSAKAVSYTHLTLPTIYSV